MGGSGLKQIHCDSITSKGSAKLSNQTQTGSESGHKYYWDCPVASRTAQKRSQQNESAQRVLQTKLFVLQEVATGAKHDHGQTSQEKSDCLYSGTSVSLPPKSSKEFRDDTS
jgi:hypothetical protein